MTDSEYGHWLRDDLNYDVLFWTGWCCLMRTFLENDTIVSIFHLFTSNLMHLKIHKHEGQSRIPFLVSNSEYGHWFMDDLNYYVVLFWTGWHCLMWYFLENDTVVSIFHLFTSDKCTCKSDKDEQQSEIPILVPDLFENGYETVWIWSCVMRPFLEPDMRVSVYYLFRLDKSIRKSDKD